MKCTSCGQQILFDPKTKGLKCPYCGQLKEINKSHENGKCSTDTTLDTHMTSRDIKCEQCGAVSNVSGADICKYCGATLENDYTGKIDTIVPFMITENEAKRYYSSWINGRFWIPKVLKGKMFRGKMEGHYIPALSFDANTFTTYQGTYEVEIQQRHGDRTFTRTETRPFSGTRKDIFLDNLYSNDTNVGPYTLDQISPFDFSEQNDYDTRYLMGYRANAIELDYTKAKKEMKERIERKIQSRACAGHMNVRSYSQNVTYNNFSYMRTLVPVYIAKCKYKGKDYEAIINGTNGKVTGTYPKSKLKVTLCTIGILLFVAAITTLIVLTFMNGKTEFVF